MNIGAYFGETQGETRRVVPEVVTPPPAVPQRENALAVFRTDPAALKASALAVLDVPLKPVQTVQAANFLADKLAQAKTVLKNIEARRKLIVEPLKKEASAVDAEARTWREPVEKHIAQMERVLLAFQRMQADESRRQEEQRQKALIAAAEKQQQAENSDNAALAGEASTEIMQLEAVEPAQPIHGFKTDSGTTSIRKVWKVEVVNEEEVPDVYRTVDLKKLQAAVDAGARQIDGCHIFEAESLVTRTRG